MNEDVNEGELYSLALRPSSFLFLSKEEWKGRILKKRVGKVRTGKGAKGEVEKELRRGIKSAIHGLGD